MGTFSRPTPSPLGGEHSRPATRGWSPGRLATYFRLAAAILDDRDAAEAVTARAFDAVWRRRHRLGTTVAFESALMREVMLLCRAHGAAAAAPRHTGGISEDEARAWNIEVRATGRTTADAPATAAPSSVAASHDAFDAVIHALPVDERAMLVLAYATDLTPDAIGSALGVPASLVHATLDRVESTLAAALAADPARSHRSGRPVALADEIRRSLPLPSAAPPALLYEAETRMALVKLDGGGTRRRRPVRLRFVVPIATVLLALVFVGSGAWHVVADMIPEPVQPVAQAELPAKVDGFGRVNTSVSWAYSGDTLYVTRDAGATWSKGSVPARGPSGIYVPSLTPPRYSPFFVDADHGWLVSWEAANRQGDPPFKLTVHRTTDGGRKWTSKELPGTYPGFATIQFVDARHGWLLVNRLDSIAPGIDAYGSYSLQPLADGTLTVLGTSDGGQSWSKLSTLPAAGPIRFVNRNEGWGQLATRPGGPAAAVVHTTDGGRTWTVGAIPGPQECPSAPAARVPAEKDGKLVLAVPCLIEPSVVQYSPADGQSSRLEFSQGAAATRPRGSRFQAIESTDGGRTWSASHAFGGSVIVAQQSPALALARITPDQPLLGTESGTLPVLMTYGAQALAGEDLMISSDEGTNWSAVPLPPGGSVEDVQFVGPDDVWVVLGSAGGSWWNGAGSVYASADRGRTWRPVLGAPALDATATPRPTPGPSGPPISPAPHGPATLPSGAILSFGLMAAPGTGWARRADGLWIFNGGQWAGPVALPADTRAFEVATERDLIVQSGDPQPDNRAHPAGTSAWLMPLEVSSDGGATWSLNEMPYVQPDGTELVSTFHFVTARHGFWYTSFTSGSGQARAATGCTVYETRDGGVTWTSGSPAPCFSEVHFDSLGVLGWGREFPPAGAIGGEPDRVWVTTDGGASWTRATIPFSWDQQEQIALMRRSDSSLEMAAWSSVGQSAGVVSFLTSIDGGSTWTQKSAGGPVLSSVAPMADGSWFGIGLRQSPDEPSILWVSTDDAGSWVGSTPRGMTGTAVWAEFSADGSGWLAAAPQGCSDANPNGCAMDHLYSTTDLGQTWDVVWGDGAISFVETAASLPQPPAATIPAQGAATGRRARPR